MKQIVTLLRAEGAQARRLVRLCSTTRKAQLFSLRNALRVEVRERTRLSAYVEYMDGWSMADDFTRVIGDGTRRRETANGELYFCIVTAELCAALRQRLRRKQQFPEQTEFVRVVASLAQDFSARDAPVTRAVFREIVGSSITDDETKDGSNQPLVVTARKLAEPQR